MPTKTYDPKKVLSLVNGIPLSGFADGSHITIAYPDPAWTRQRGSHGDVIRSKTNSEVADVTIVLLATALSNDLLMVQYNLDRLANSGLFNLVFKDLNGNSLHATDGAWVEKLPDKVYAGESEANSWSIHVGKMEGFIGGTL